MTADVAPLIFQQIGATEIVLILLVLVLLFGARKLPELARGSGRALRIFKAETKGLIDSDDDDTKTEEQREIEAQRRADAAATVEEPEAQRRSDTER